jgi:hypothetical protein
MGGRYGRWSRNRSAKGMEERDTAPVKDFWDILKILGVVISTVAIPIIIGFVGHWVNASLKERDVRLRTVELAIGILKEDPKAMNRETTALRQWAMDVIDTYSGVALPEAARSELRDTPIIRSRARSSCLEGRVSLEVPINASVAVTKRDDWCEMSVDGARIGHAQTITCENFKASVTYPEQYAATKIETEKSCEITLALPKST